VQPFLAASVKNNAGPDKQGFHGEDALQKRRPPAQLIAQRHDPVQKYMINRVAGSIDIHLPLSLLPPDSRMHTVLHAVINDQNVHTAKFNHILPDQLMTDS
jgi:hypothetical protein